MSWNDTNIYTDSTFDTCSLHLDEQNRTIMDLLFYLPQVSLYYVYWLHYLWWEMLELFYKLLSSSRFCPNVTHWICPYFIQDKKLEGFIYKSDIVFINYRQRESSDNKLSELVNKNEEEKKILKKHYNSNLSVSITFPWLIFSIDEG